MNRGDFAPAKSPESSKGWPAAPSQVNDERILASAVAPKTRLPDRMPVSVTPDGMTPFPLPVREAELGAGVWGACAPVSPP